MAAVYLHNALYTPSADPRDTLAHSRNLSTISNATLHTSTTLHSHPSEPLLQPTTNPGAATAYYDQISRQPRNRDGTPARLRWDDRPSLDAPTPVGEKGRYWRNGTKRPMEIWRRVTLTLEIIMGSWAVYNTVRYFLAFTHFSDSGGQAFCLALGTSAGCSFALTCCSLILSLLKKKLIVFGLAYKYLTHIRSSLLYLASLCLLAPAAINFALTFVWKTSVHPQLDLRTRCHLDIDVVWSVSRTQCTEHGQSWTNWVVLSSVRLGATLVVIVAYHAISTLHPKPPRRPMNRHRRTDSYPTMPHGPSSSSMLMPPPLNSPDATLVGDIYTSAPSRIRLARSRSSGLSETGTSAEQITFGRSTFPAALDQEGDREMTGFVDRFRSLLSQITQETEEALELARSDGALSPENSREVSSSTPNDLPPSYSPNYDHDESEEDDEEDEDDAYDQSRQHHHHSNSNNIFNLPTIPPALGYNEFGLPYPPDENVHVLGGVIRRMPTIESMGSGEVNSVTGASSYRPNGSVHTSSRPPTRNTLLSFNGTEYELPSGPPSRANSLSARAEYLSAMSTISQQPQTSEHGELSSRSEASMRRLTTSPTSFLEYQSSGTGGTPEAHSTGTGSGTTGSYGTTTTYHTATSGSADSYPPGLYHEGTSTAAQGA